MSSGQRRVDVNTRERAVSTDLVRAQSFIGRAAAELQRFLLFATTFDETGAGGNETVQSSSLVTGPLRARIISGLRARPEVGTTNLFVEPGIAVVVDPDTVPHPDDSPAKVIIDSGVTLAGELTMTAGDAALVRIDVVEFSRTELVIEADSRDQYDIPSSLFVPASMNKASEGSLNWRIRLGTPGGGFPGVVQGWTPVAVCKVPALAATWNDVTVWDVRPLISDLTRPPFDELAQWQRYGRRQYGIMRNVLPAGATTFSGFHESTIFNFRAGGFISPAVDLDDAANTNEPGLALVSNRPWYIYLLFPFGLPRWVRYTDAPTLRVPGNYRGIPVLTQKAPNGMLSTPSAAISIPTGLGLGGSTIFAAVIASGGVSGAGNLIDSLIEDGETLVGDPGLTISPTSVAAGAATYDFVADTHHPANVSAILVRFATDITIAASGVTVSRACQLFSSDLVNLWTFQERFTRASPSGGTWVEEYEVWIPLWPNLPSTLGATHRVISLHTVVGGSPTFANQSARVLGWRTAM